MVNTRYSTPKQTHHRFRLGTINVRTCKCESKLADCVTQCKNLAQDIVCMQETRIRGEGEIKFDDCVLKDWHVIYNGMSIARAGVAIVMAPHVRLMDVEHIMEGRITMIRVKVHWVKLAIYSCYSPTEEYSTSSKETFHRTLQRAMLQMRKEHPSYKIIGKVLAPTMMKIPLASMARNSLKLLSATSSIFWTLCLQQDTMNIDGHSTLTSGISVD